MARRIEIPKGAGRVRVVYALRRDERAVAQALAARVWAIALALGATVDRAAGYPVAHCRPGRSAVTQAQVHARAGLPYGASADLADYYDSIGTAAVAAAAGAVYAECASHAQRVSGGLVRPGQAAVQGSPVAPAIGELVGAMIDRAIIDWLRARGAAVGRDVIYTRYCDDLALSAASQAIVSDWIDALPVLLRRHGLALAPSKTRRVTGAVRTLCGVATSAPPRPPRPVRRRARAAAHGVVCALRDALRADQFGAQALADALLLVAAARLREAAGLAEWVRAAPPDHIRSAARLLARGAEWLPAARAVAGGLGL